MTDDVCDQTGQVYIDYLMIDNKWYFSSFWKTLSVSDKKIHKCQDFYEEICNSSALY